ncbi:hypothetical protein Pat9b_4850 (plasmid) [Pantoea sp. At-9b]|jgi:hypothetical protein|nr:hypothetical protein Pat9b_4850 [Pantoea sp. At-9b]
MDLIPLFLLFTQKHIYIVLFTVIICVTIADLTEYRYLVPVDREKLISTPYRILNILSCSIMLILLPVTAYNLIWQRPPTSAAFILISIYQLVNSTGNICIELWVQKHYRQGTRPSSGYFFRHYHMVLLELNQKRKNRE